MIGAGALGRSLALALHDAGVSIAAVYSAGGTSARTLGRRVSALTSGILTADAPLSPFVILAVPDDRIAAVAAQLRKHSDADRIRTIIHCSGAFSGDVLRPLMRRGTSIASMHPLMTFPKSGKRVPLKGAWFALEGDRVAVTDCRRLVRKLGASSFTISGKKKSLYHLAAVFASNYPVTLLGVVEQLAADAGVPRKDIWRIFRPLVLAAVNNVLESSPAAALTGPIARGDRATVLRHVQSLGTSKRLNHLLPLYAALGVETAALAQRKR